MFYALHRKIRNILLTDLQAFVDRHPFYSNTIKPETLVNSFDVAKTQVSDNYNFEGRQFPVIVFEGSDSREHRLSFNRQMEWEEAHCRVCSELSYLLARVEDDINFTGTYTDGVYLLELVSSRPGSNEEIELRVSPATLRPGVTYNGLPDLTQFISTGPYTYHPITADGVYTNIIPGARIWLESFNCLRPGVNLIVETFANKVRTGTVYGNRQKMDCRLKIYTHTQYQTEELTDILLDWMQWQLPRKLFYGHTIDFLTANATNVITKQGDLGEETFSADINFGLSMEHQYFVPNPSLGLYVLYIQYVENL